MKKERDPGIINILIVTPLVDLIEHAMDNELCVNVV